MENILQTIGLVKEIRLGTTLPKVEIARRLNLLIENRKSTDTTEDNARKLYKGKISYDAFEFRRKPAFHGFDSDSQIMVKVLGSLEDSPRGTTIYAKVVAQARHAMIIYLCIPVFLLMMGTVSRSTTGAQMLVIAAIFIFIGAFQFFRLRIGISKMSRLAMQELKKMVQ